MRKWRRQTSGVLYVLFRSRKTVIVHHSQLAPRNDLTAICVDNKLCVIVCSIVIFPCPRHGLPVYRGVHDYYDIASGRATRVRRDVVCSPGSGRRMFGRP